MIKLNNWYKSSSNPEIHYYILYIGKSTIIVLNSEEYKFGLYDTEDFENDTLVDEPIYKVPKGIEAEVIEYLFDYKEWSKYID